MKRSIGTVSVALLAVLCLAFPAQGAVTWCKTDPVVQLNSTLVDIQLEIPLEYVPLVNGPTRFEVQTPNSTVRELILSDLGYNGHGTEVIFTDGGGAVKDSEIPTEIEVYVPIDESQLVDEESVPARLTVTAENALPVVFEGTTELTWAELSIIED